MIGFDERLSFAMSLNPEYNMTSLGKAVGLSFAQISNYLKNKSYPRLEKAQWLAFVLKVDYQWLKYGIGNHSIPNQEYLMDQFHSTMQERIIFLIWWNNTSPLELSRKLGLKGSTTITYWMEGERLPSENGLALISNFFKVDPNWILEGK